MNRFKNIILALGAVILIVIPFFVAKNADFGGTDNEAQKVISEVNSNYKPWFKPLWQPPSKEVETLLFSLQAAIGAGFIGYFIGLSRGKKQK